MYILTKTKKELNKRKNKPIIPFKKKQKKNNIIVANMVRGDNAFFSGTKIKLIVLVVAEKNASKVHDYEKKSSEERSSGCKILMVSTFQSTELIGFCLK